MHLRFFWIPAHDSQTAEQEMNRFLFTNRIIQVEKAFSASASTPGWSICVQWLPPSSEGGLTAPKGKAGKIDYRETLDDETFRIFVILRTWRKDKAAERTTGPNRSRPHSSIEVTDTWAPLPQRRSCR